MDINRELRHNREIREEVLNREQELQDIGREFRSELDLPPMLDNQYVIATGHQPVIYYPGLLFKNYFVGIEGQKKHITSLNFIVDTDQDSIEVPLPCLEKGNICKEWISLKEDKETVFASFSPAKQKLDEFFDGIKKRTSKLKSTGIAVAFEAWEQQFREIYEKQKSYLQTMTRLRSDFERSLGLHLANYRVSDWIQTHAYYRFIRYIVNHLEEFKDAYNQAVDSYRSGTYQPVKKIQEQDGWIELPFWLLKNNRRHPVWLNNRNGKIILASGDADFNTEIKITSEEEVINQMKNKSVLYPKATTLTLIIRLFFTDLFIHGTGAVEYEQVNNAFFKYFFKRKKAPSFYAVTGDIYLPLVEGVHDHAELKKKNDELRKWLKEARRNPEDLLDQETSSKYKERKKELAGQMRRAENGKQRRTIHQKMEELNDEMKGLLRGQIKDAEDKLEKYQELLKNEHILFERQYPYFIYPQNTLTRKQFHSNLRYKKYNNPV